MIKSPQTLPVLFSVLLSVASMPAAEPLVVPGATAYSLPRAGALQTDERRGVMEWRDPSQSVVWFGQFKQPGDFSAKVKLRVPAGTTLTLQLTAAGVSSRKTVQGAAEPQEVDFGNFRLSHAGYQRLTLEAMDAGQNPPGEVIALVLDGPAVESAHFNLEPRRNAASVHLMFPVPKEKEITGFYNEVTGVEDPVHTYYMACGFSRGYFGMQVNSRTERRIIFSVWDGGSGENAQDRSSVAEENHTTLLAKGPGVDAGVFGNEGTGGHSHLVYPWKTGETQKFFVSASVEGKFTDYTGYWFHPEQKAWQLIARFHAPQDGNYLHGLYSFSENFGGETGHLLRKARYGNQWIQTRDGTWTELLTAAFSHDGTGKEARLDRFMGVEDGQFFLSHGGFVEGFTSYGTRFNRPATSTPPELKLPAVP